MADGSHVVERITAHFRRQLACYEAMERELRASDERIDAGEEFGFEAERDLRAVAAGLRDEMDRLLEEWRATRGVTPRQREEVRARAREVEEKARALSALSEDVADRCAVRLEALGGSLEELRRGRRVLSGYRPGTGAEEAGLMDRKA